MRRSLTAAVLSAAFSLRLSAQSPSLKMIEIPLSDCGGMPCVEMQTAAGKPLHLLIDLAQPNAYLDSKAARTLDLELKPLQGAGGGDIPDVQQTVVAGAKLGDLPMGDFPFMVLDTAPQPSQPGPQSPPLPADGGLTYRSFKDRLVQIDFPHHALRISEPLRDPQPCPRTCSPLVIKHFGRFGPVTLTTKGFEVNGQSMDAQIDTLFTGTLLIYPLSLEKLGLKKVKKDKTKESFPFMQGGIQLVHSAKGASESFQGVPLLQDAPIYFAPADRAFPELQFDATVGSGLLSHGVVTFDFKGMQMWIEGSP
jgi:hypothetical protein